MSFYYGSLENDGYGGRGGKGGKKSGTKGAAKSKGGTTAKKTHKVSPTLIKKAGKLGASLVKSIPVAGDIAVGAANAYRAFTDDGNTVVDQPMPSATFMQTPKRLSGSPVMGADGNWYLKPKKKRRKGLSGSDLRGYMRTVKLAKLLIHTPRYMKKSVGKARRRSSHSF